MRRICLSLLLISNALILTAQSGAVLKGGVLWRDFERDNKSVLSRSAPGFYAGLEVRLAADERTYFKPSMYVARIQAFSQSHFDDTQIFSIEDGYDVLIGALGLETRLIDAGRLHWRMSISGYADYLVNVRGNVTFEELSSAIVGLMIGSGLDLGAFVDRCDHSARFSRPVDRSQPEPARSIGDFGRVLFLALF